MKTLDTMRGILKDPEPIITEWKAKGKKVLGYRCSYVPEEIIYAADVLPYPLFGTPEAIVQADSYFQFNICEFIRNIFDLALQGKFSFLDGLVLCNTCDAVRKLYDHWNTYIKTPFCYIIDNPQLMNTELGYKYYGEELKRFKKAIEDFAGTSISDESLQKSIDLYNETRALVKELYSFRKEKPPRISGVEALDITMATMLMPKDKSNRLLRQLISEVKARQDGPKASGPRILLTGSIIDNPTLIQLVEDVGGTVVVEDLCTAIKHFWHEVKDGKDPLDALCHHGTERCICACMHPPEGRLDYLHELIEEYAVDGIIYLTLKYCDPFLYEGVLFRDKLQAQGTPTILLETEHSLSGLGQLRTRIQAFVEML